MTVTQKYGNNERDTCDFINSEKMMVNSIENSILFIRVQY
jgi:hypothetical protein